MGEENLQEKQEETLQEKQEETTGQEQKTFTQDEVNSIIKSRLERAKLEVKQNAAFEKREAELNARELRLTAMEALAAAGLPGELASVINCSDPETITNNVAMLSSLLSSGSSGMSAKPAADFVPKAAAGSSSFGTGYKISMSAGTNNNGSGGADNLSDPDLRKAFGLKGDK